MVFNNIIFMGNCCAIMGDAFKCCRKHSNVRAIMNNGQANALGRDLNDAVLAATNQTIMEN
jgi:hypothetical protein